jgi:hypothetical protein
VPKGIPKKGKNKGWFKKGEHPSKTTEFKKGNVPWFIRKGKSNPVVGKREKHWNWKGGITDIEQDIRNLPKNKFWIKGVFKRDNYTCQLCDKRGVYLEAHHLEGLARLVEKFLKEYSNFNTIKDKWILLKLAVSYKPFWNIKNGITLCKHCHNSRRNWMKRNKLGRFT